MENIVEAKPFVSVALAVVPASDPHNQRFLSALGKFLSQFYVILSVLCSNGDVQ
jgi:hypothetical protein